MFVFGFFLDGEDGQQPVIMGVIGFNDYTAVMAEVPDAKFVPFTGINPALWTETCYLFQKGNTWCR